MRLWFAAGVGLNGLCAAEALRRRGSGREGLRLAARATGQVALLPYAVYYAGGRLERRPRSVRRRWLWLYAGTHVPHAAAIGTLIRRHGHPAAGTPVYPLSVYGGSFGYLCLLYLLGLGPDRSGPVGLARAAEDYIFVAVQGLPIPHALATKDAPLGAYGLVTAVWLAAAKRRLLG